MKKTPNPAPGDVNKRYSVVDYSSYIHLYINILPPYETQNNFKHTKSFLSLTIGPVYQPVDRSIEDSKQYYGKKTNASDLSGGRRRVSSSG